MLYESSKLIVLSTADGSLVRSQSNADMRCNLGCAFLYITATINLVAVMWNSGASTQYTGLVSFNPDTGISGSGIGVISCSTYTFQNPVLTFTNEGRVLMGAYSSSPSYSMVLGMPDTFSGIHHIGTVLANTKVRGISIWLSSGKRAFMYIEDNGIPNQFFIFRYILDTTLPVSDVYFSFISPANTKIEFLDFIAYSYYNTYCLVYFLTTMQVVLFDTYEVANPSRYAYTQTQLLTTPSYLNMGNGKIFLSPSVRYYIGGNDAWQLVSQSSGPGVSLSDKTAFVFSFQQSESLQTIQASTVLSVIPNSAAQGGAISVQCQFIAFGIIASATVSSTVTLSDVTSPTTITNDCLTQITPTSFPVALNYYIGDSFQLSHSIAPFTQCASLSCLYSSALDQAWPTVALTYSAQVSTVITTDTSLDGQIIFVRFIAQSPPSLLSGCAFYFNNYQLSVVNILINTVTISDIYYNLATTPTTLYTQFTAFTNNKGISGDASKITINYNLVKSDGTPYDSSFITGFNSATRTISVLTSDTTLPRVHLMKIVAYFTYLPSKTVEVPFSIIIDKCFTTTITSQTFDRIVYQIGTPNVDYDLSNIFSNTYGTDCGAFYITATFTPNSAITFTGVTPAKFSIQTNDASLDGQYTVILTVTLIQPVTNIQYANLSLTTSIILFDPVATYLIPQTVDGIDYYIKDPLMDVTLPFFSASKPYIQALYSLSNQDDSLIDANIFKFDPITRDISVQTLDLTKLGVYLLKLKVYFSTSSLYFITDSFDVHIHHNCERNLITAPVVSDVQYSILDPTLTYTMGTWMMSMQDDCAPIKYTAKLVDGSALPNFIKLDSSSPPGLKIYTPLSKDAKDYAIIVRGVSSYYDQMSSIASRFTLKVTCTPKKLTPQDRDMTQNFLIGSIFPLQIKLKEFLVTPSCKDSAVTYSVSMAGGGILPLFIQFDSTKLYITVSDNGGVNVGAYQIQFEGSIGFTLKSIVSINLQVSVGNGKDLDNVIVLDPLSVDVFANIKISKTLASKDFSVVTQQPYSLMNIDQSLTFISFSNQQLSLLPTSLDVGKHFVYFLSETDDKSKRVSQLVTINVKSNGQNALQEVSSIISDISNSGLVYVDFNTQLVVPNNWTYYLDNSTLTLLISNKDGIALQNKIFTWAYKDFLQTQPKGATTVLGYQGSRLTIQLIFSDPLSVSIGDYDYLNIMVMNRTLFKDKNTGMMIPFRYKMVKKIPKQLDSTMSSKYLDNFSTMVQSGINIIASSSNIIQFVFAFSMSRLWGMVKSIQIILMFPLTLVDMPANVQLLYFFMTYNFNMELIPTDSLSFKFLDFSSSQYPEQTPFNDKFDDQGYNSLYFLENGSANVSNINSTIGFCLAIIILRKLLSKFNKTYKVVEILYQLLVFNFLIGLMLECSLTFMIFSFVNIVQYDRLESDGQFYSYLIACIYIIAYIGIFVMLKKLVNMNYMNGEIPEVELYKKYPMVEVLFSLLRSESKDSMQYYAIFLIRRMILAVIIVFINDHFMQIYSLIFVSLASFAYMIQIRPFDEPILNKLETFNECIILVCCYHMLFFSEANPDIKLKYQAGWSMDMLIIVMFFINVFTYCYGFLKRVKLILRGLLIKTRAKLYQKQCDEEGNIYKPDANNESALLPQQMQQTPPLMIEDVLPYYLENQVEVKTQKNQQLDNFGFAYRFDDLAQNHENSETSHSPYYREYQQEGSQSVQDLEPEESVEMNSEQRRVKELIYNSPLPHQIEETYELQITQQQY